MILVWKRDPAYILTLEPTNIEGTVECLSKMTLSLGLKTSLSCTKKILRHVLGATWLNLNVLFLAVYKLAILFI